MELQPRIHKQAIAVKWMKSETGNTYICPLNAMQGIENPTDEQLRMHCVEESLNPQND